MLLTYLIATPLIAALVSSAKKNARLLRTVAAVASLLELAAALLIAAAVWAEGSYAWQPYLAVDALGTVILLLLAIVGAATAWYSGSYLHIEVAKNIIGLSRVRQYFVLAHLFLCAMFFAVTTTSPTLLWVAVEATTLSTVFLVSFYNKPKTVEAAWKYFIINSIGLLFGFFGTLLFLYPAIHGQTAELVRWSTLLSTTGLFDPAIAKIGFIFVLIGYGTKIGLVPMHTWRPDAYSKAPLPIVALFSGGLLNVAFLAVLKFKAVTDLTVGKEFSQSLLVFFGVVSISVAALSIFNQKNYKRLFAYSSIEHAGLMALGFGFGGLGAVAALLHMVYHALAKSALFLTAGNIFLKYASTKIKNITGGIQTLPVTSVLLLIEFLAVAGIPPFGIFMTEFLIVSSGLAAHPLAVIITLASLAVVCIGFLRQVMPMVFGEKPAAIVPGENGLGTLAPIIMLLALLVMTSIFIPPGVFAFLSQAVAGY